MRGASAGRLRLPPGEPLSGDRAIQPPEGCSVSRRVAIVSILLALAGPLALASSHEPPPPGLGNDCNTHRDATQSSPIPLDGTTLAGGWCYAEVGSATDQEDWFTFPATEGDSIFFDAEGLNMDVWLCMWTPMGRNLGCSNWGFDVATDETGTHRIEATPIQNWGGDDYRITLTKSSAPPNNRPIMSGIQCLPSPVAVNATVRCRYVANDDGWIQYSIDWDDGGPVQQPGGYTSPGVVQEVARTFSAARLYNVRIWASDGYSVSQVMTWPLTVQVNQPARVQAFSCSPTTGEPGQAVMCTVAAIDDSNGAFLTVDWGDGATSRAPASGYATPGTYFTVAHAYATSGVFSARATGTDDQGATGAAIARSITILARETFTGSLLLGQPASHAETTLSDAGAPSFDATRFRLSGDPRTVALVWQGIGPADLDVRFYREDGSALLPVTDSRCAKVSTSASEACTAPPGARWAVVTATLGVDVEFTLTHRYV